MNIYIDAVASDTGNVTGGVYTAMEDTAALVKVGAAASSNFFLGKIAGGPCGPFFAHKELSAEEVAALDAFCRQLMQL